MSVTKHKILDSALTFFLDKGYLATSIQNITDDCGVAKGSFYKFFHSKEDLFIEVHMQQQQRMFDRIVNLRADVSLSVMEIFIQETECQLEFFVDNNFIMQEMNELATPNRKIEPCLFRLRANILNYNREMLIKVFGDHILPNIWDFVIIYNGIIRELVFLMIFENKSLIFRDMAVFVVHCMEDMVANRRGITRPSLLKDSDMNEYVSYALRGEQVPDCKRIFDLIEQLISTIKELPITNSEKAELQEATVLIQEELESKHPRSVLLRSLIAFLDRENELKDILIPLEKILTKQFPKENCNLAK
ncbi:MAG: TetR/AcrR family transcriptional regulator [Gorillibacterium sp.]|nr:TetR/AcrR family transcriptional regulator [Gorillibacterium sp.]